MVAVAYCTQNCQKTSSFHTITLAVKNSKKIEKMLKGKGPTFTDKEVAHLLDVT